MKKTKSKKISILFLILFCTKSYAGDSIAIGVQSQENNKRVLLGDYNTFDSRRTLPYGVHQYGLGRGEFEVGNPIGIMGEANNGFMVGNKGLAIGLEPLNGNVGYERYGLEAAWRPGVSLGYHNESLYVGPRYVYMTGTNSNYYKGAGIGAIVQYGPFVYLQNPGMKIISFSLNKILNVERRTDDILGETWYFMFRTNLK